MPPVKGGEMKVAERKEEQGWTMDNPQCKNCDFYSSDIKMIKSQWSSQEYKQETDIRCTLGKFATKKTAWCKKWIRAK